MAQERRDEASRRDVQDLPFTLDNDIFFDNENVLDTDVHAHYNCECRPTEIRDAYWIVGSARDAPSHTSYVPSNQGWSAGDSFAWRVSGKWLVFAYPGDHDTFWARIRDATAAGRLGPVSKAATALGRDTESNANSLVTCVYTTDYRDLADLGRVLAELRHLEISGRLSYKTDSDTLSGRYGDGAAIYTSPPGSFEFSEPQRRRSASPSAAAAVRHRTVS